MPLPPMKAGDELAKADTYDTDRKARAFWRASYKCGRGYGASKDATGSNLVLIKHEREQDDSFQRRMRFTKVRNHCGPLIRKYNDFVWRAKPSRDDANPLYTELIEDADNKGHTLDEVMRRALLRAQIEREVYLYPDSNAKPVAPGQERTAAQAEADGVRMFLRTIGADSVPWWRDSDGELVEALIVMEDADGKPFALYVNAMVIQRVNLEEKTVEGTGQKYLTFQSMDVAKPHNAGKCPLVRMRPLFDDADPCDGTTGESQISPLAELQQAVYNGAALLWEEVFNVTFSQIVATGVAPSDVGEVKLGNNRILCLPNDKAKFELIGADPAQAISIANAIMGEQTELYRIAGVDSGNPLEKSGAAESGVARAFRFNDLAANLSALADACEAGENAVVERLFAMSGRPEPEPADYPDDFDQPLLADELEVLARALTVPQMPLTIQNALTKRFAERNLQLTEEEANAMEGELSDAKDMANAAASASAFPPPKPTMNKPPNPGAKNAEP